MANQNVTQLSQQSGSASATSLFYAVVGGNTDTGLPLSVLVNNLGLTGTPTTPTATTGTNTTQIASTAFVQAQLTSSLASYAPLASPTFTGTTTIPTIALSGGTINGTTIGATTSAAGTFTSLTATSTTSLVAVTCTGLITPSSTIGIKGTGTNDSAQAGSVGEYSSNSTLTTSITTATGTNATSLSLTAGDWDVQAIIGFTPASSTLVSRFQAGVSTTSATFGSFGTYSSQAFGVPGTGVQINSYEVLTSPVVRISLSATTTVYAIAVSNFTGSTMTTDGFLRARRVR